MNWNTVRSGLPHDFRIFQVRTETKQSATSGVIHDFVVIDSVNWVNTVALTPDNRIVMVEQFRHGTNAVELEIPGGLIDAGDSSAIVAGERELREETGYSGKPAQLLATTSPNPAIMSNQCHTVLVQNCSKLHDTAFDHTEELVTHLIPVEEINRLVASGRIHHSIVLVALYHFDLWRRGLKPEFTSTPSPRP